MRITNHGDSGFTPARAMKAYGAKTSFAAAGGVPTGKPAVATTGDASAAGPRPDSYQPSQAVQGLVAGTVKQGVHFDPASGASAASAAAVPGRVLQMYARAADRVEAAVGVQLGRALDVRG